MNRPLIHEAEYSITSTPSFGALVSMASTDAFLANSPIKSNMKSMVSALFCKFAG